MVKCYSSINIQKLHKYCGTNKSNIHAIFDFFIIVILDGYKIIVNQKKISCQTNGGNQLRVFIDVNASKCKKICDRTHGCMFFLLRHEPHHNSCYTFKTCDENKREFTRSFGIIYASTSSKLFLFIFSK